MPDLPKDYEHRCGGDLRQLRIMLDTPCAGQKNITTQAMFDAGEVLSREGNRPRAAYDDMLPWVGRSFVPKRPCGLYIY
jgi:hypothetical protein